MSDSYNPTPPFFSNFENVEAWESFYQKEVVDKLEAQPSDLPVLVLTCQQDDREILVEINRLLSTLPVGILVIVTAKAVLSPALEQELHDLDRQPNLIFVFPPDGVNWTSLCNQIIQWSVPRDVVLLQNKVQLTAGWLEKLQAVANQNGNIGTVIPLSNNLPFAPDNNYNWALSQAIQEMGVTPANQIIKANSLKLYPVIPTAVAGCVYLRRFVLEDVGFLNEEWLNPEEAVMDYSQRLLRASFLNVLADDVLAYYPEIPESFEKDFYQTEAYARLDARYIWFNSIVRTAQSNGNSQLARVCERTRGVLTGYKIAIDAVSLTGDVNGTQLYTLELVRSLTEQQPAGMHLSIIINDEVSLENLYGLDKLVKKVYRAKEVRDLPAPIFDLIHRPFHLSALDDFYWLKSLATRVVYTHLDNILSTNPTYEGPGDWQQRQKCLELIFEYADGVSYLSEYVANECEYLGLVTPPERQVVFYSGVDHSQIKVAPKIPREVAPLSGKPFLFMIGARYTHKHSLYAIKLLAMLQQKYNWDGYLVFAGQRMELGSAELGELKLIEKFPKMNHRIIWLGMISEAEKSWLMSHMSLLLYPSSSEGFGLVPFEAARAGKPALTTNLTCLGEILGDEVSYFHSYNPEKEVDLVWELLSDENKPNHQVAAINRRALDFSWEQLAGRAWSFYEQLLKLPPRRRAFEHAMKYKASLEATKTDYAKLEAWAAGLNDELLKLNAKPITRVLRKLNL